MPIREVGPDGELHEIVEPELSLADGRIVVVDNGMHVVVDGEMQWFSQMGHRLLTFLANNPDRYVAPEEIEGVLYQAGERVPDQGVESAMLYVRTKLGLGTHDLGNGYSGVLRHARGVGDIALRSLNPEKVGIPSPDETVHRFADDTIEVNPGRHIVRLAGRWLETPVSTNEFAVLDRLAQTPGVAVSLTELLQLINMPQDLSSEKTLRGIVLQIRDKLGPTYARAIKTVRGAGYLAVDSF